MRESGRHHHCMAGSSICLCRARLDLYNGTRVLYLTNNPIVTLSDGWLAQVMPQLQVLDVQNISLSTITDNTFSQLLQLRLLFLTDNPLIAIHDDAFATNPLIGLWLEGCGLKQIPKAAQAEATLERLDMGSNLLTQLTATNLTNLTQLLVLSIRSNPITVINKDAFARNQRLKELYIGFLAGPAMPLSVFDPLMQLESLGCAADFFGRRMRLEDRHFEKLTRLTRLDLGFQRESVRFIAAWDKSFAQR